MLSIVTSLTNRLLYLLILFWLFGYSGQAFSQEKVHILDRLEETEVPLQRLTSELKKLSDQAQSDLVLPLLDALIDHKKNYAPQALRKLRNLCQKTPPEDLNSKAGQVYRLSCIFYLLQLDQMAKDSEAIELENRLSQKSWWKDRSEHLKYLVEAHLNASYWRIGSSKVRVDAITEALNKKGLLYSDQRSLELRKLRMSLGLAEANPNELLKQFQNWAKKHRFYEKDNDYYKVLSFKADLLGAAGQLEERFSILEQISKKGFDNLASFPELRLSALLIDLDHTHLCATLIKNGSKRIERVPLYLHRLLHSEQKLAVSWCALSLGLPELAHRLLDELAQTPQRVGYRYRTRAQWEFMIHASRLVAIQAYQASLNVLGQGHIFKRLSLYYQKRIIKKQLRKALISIMDKHNPASNPAEIALIPYSFYPLILEYFGDTSALLDQYPPNGTSAWFKDWLDSAFKQRPLPHNFKGIGRLGEVQQSIIEKKCSVTSPFSFYLVPDCMSQAQVLWDISASNHDEFVIQVDIKVDQKQGQVMRKKSSLLGAHKLTIKQLDGETDQRFMTRLKSLALASPDLSSDLYELIRKYYSSTL